MIEDLDGATVEPTRRGHLLVLSAAMAALALALLVALVVPPSVGTVALAPSEAPSVSGAPTMTVVSGGASLPPGNGRVTLEQLRLEQGSPVLCVAPRPDVWGPFVLDGVSYVVGERTGPAVLLPPSYAATSWSGWLTLNIYDRTGQRLLYTCGESEALPPRIDLTTIQR